MTLTDILLTIIIQTLFCLGLRVLLSEGQILHFIRRPFEYDDVTKIMNIFTFKYHVRYEGGSDAAEKMQNYRKKSRIIGWILKPFILCVICFSSVWGGAVFICLHGISLLLLPQLIITCVSTAFLIYVIIDYVEF